MILEMKVPSPGESITEVEIAQWLVSDGDFVEKDQAIAEVDSDKATLELPAENSGIITLKAEEGDSVAVGQVVCLINTEGKQKIDTDKKNNVELSSESVKEVINETKENYASGSPSPAAKKILDEKGILPESIIGTGRNARITKEDAILAKPSMGSQTENQARENSRKKLSLLRRKLAQRLVTVKNETAMLTTFNEVDMNSIFSIRSEFKEQFKQKHEVGLGFMSFFTKAVVRALKLFPDVNSMIDGDYQIINDFYDISVAVSGPKGLMVPVLRNVEKMTFKDIESEIKRLAIRARDGEITVDEMTGGTFTISNGGVFGSMLSTPILNPPQSAILGMHNIVERPTVVDGEIKIRPIMYLALSYDHRIIDGKESVSFLKMIKENLEDPRRLFLDI